MKKAIVSVSNDLYTDQRVHKICHSLQQQQYEVILLGRHKKNSKTLRERNYSLKRMHLFFEQGPLFYLELQIRLFYFLLFHAADILIAIDLDTLLPNYIISKLKKTSLIYDSHELFCEVPELQNKPYKKSIWKMLESTIFPRLKHVFTVNQSIANIYSQAYQVPVKVIRNIPVFDKHNASSKLTKADLGIPADKKIILFQGAGININRGAEEAVAAMQQINNAVLLLIGGGDVWLQLKNRCNEMNLADKVIFINHVPFEELKPYTALADIGLSLDKNNNDNYRFSLPNKIFDYMHAGLPILASSLMEVESIIKKHDIGICIEQVTDDTVAIAIRKLLSNPKQLAEYKSNALNAASQYDWNKEVKVLLKAVTRADL